MVTASSGLMQKLTARQSAWARLTAAARPRRPLSHREFAEKYITMPSSGPRGGERFKASWQPAIGLLWDELDRDYWKEVAVTGPVQASKSFGALVVPTLRDVVELNLSPIVGVPEADMFADKWDKDFRPVLEASPDLAWLIPESGSGSKGGRVKDRVTLSNNVDIKVMSRGGQATNKAGYTSPRLRITEAAGFSEASASERDEEADAYRQLLGRLGAFKLADPRRLVLIEGTGTIDEHLPWRLRGADDDPMLISSRSRIMSPCPHCEAWISPDREHLKGWQNAESALQVLEQSHFVCPSCSHPIDDIQRNKSMQDCRLVHWGQEIKPDGTITGQMPETLRLWFRWSAWHNLLLDAGDTAIKEWEASQIEDGTIDRENAERDLAQKSWAVPFQSKFVENEKLKPRLVRMRRTEWARGEVPPDTKFVTIGVDIGKWTAWWVAIAFRENGLITIIAYGSFDVCRGTADEIQTRILQSLRKFRDEVVDAGFPVAGLSHRKNVDLIIIDIGWEPDAIAEFLRETGRGFSNKFQGFRGRGSSMGQRGGTYAHPKRISNMCPRIGMQWMVEVSPKRRILEGTFNADFWKLYMQERLRTKEGSKGALSFFRADTKNEHAKLSNHLCADQLESVFDPKKGLVNTWVRHGDNHWGDSTIMALIGGDWLGYKLVAIDGPEPQAEETTTEQKEANWFARMRA